MILNEHIFWLSAERLAWGLGRVTVSYSTRLAPLRRDRARAHTRHADRPARLARLSGGRETGRRQVPEGMGVGATLGLPIASSAQ